MDVSVVIACKNEVERIGTMLESLSRQSFDGSWEVVVADNGSTDGTPRVVESYGARLPRLLLIDASAQAGVANARNRGVEHSAGTKILFVDGDDEVGEGYVAAMAGALEEAELVCARLGFDRLNPAWARVVRAQRWQQERPIDPFGFLPFAGSGTLGIRRSLFEEAGGFRHYARPSQFEEADLCWRIQLAGHSAPVLVPEAVLHYRLPSTLRGWYLRGRNYGRGRVGLYEAYRDRGMAPPRRVSLRNLAAAAWRIRSRRDLARMAQELGHFVGQRSARALG